MERNDVLAEQITYTILQRTYSGMRIAICDDEKIIIEELKKGIYEYSNAHKMELVVETFSCGEDLLSALDTSMHFDITFLDFKMDGIDGLLTARKIRERNISSAIVFLTAYSHFVIDSFEVSTFRFLEKPLSTLKLHKTLDAYFDAFGNDYPLALMIDRSKIFLETKNILYVEAIGKRCSLHLAKETYLSAKTLKEVGELLPQNHFFRIGKSFIINLNYVFKISGYTVTFKNGVYLPIGRAYLAPLKEKHMKYVKGRVI